MVRKLRLYKHDCNRLERIRRRSALKQSVRNCSVLMVRCNRLRNLKFLDIYFLQEFRLQKLKSDCISDLLGYLKISHPYPLFLPSIVQLYFAKTLGLFQHQPTHLETTKRFEHNADLHITHFHLLRSAGSVENDHEPPLVDSSKKCHSIIKKLLSIMVIKN